MTTEMDERVVSGSPARVSALSGRLRRRGIPSSVSFGIGLVALLVAGVLVGRAVDLAALRTSWDAMRAQPLSVAVALGAFGLAFVIRAVVWQRVLPGLSFGQSLAGIHLALGANHVLPLRLGEPVRVVSVVRRTDVSFDAATASTVTLRAADIVAVVGLGWLVAPAAFSRVVGPWVWAVVAVITVLGLVGLWWMVSVRRRLAGTIRLPGPLAAAGTVVAWLCEAVLVWQCAHWAGIDLTPMGAVLVTTVAVSAQIAAIAPSGFGTYEAASVAAYSSLGHDAGAGLVAALLAHALKTAYSLVAGGVASFVPLPGLAGRFRLPRTPDDAVEGAVDGVGPASRTSGAGEPVAPTAPIVVFLPAHDEEATVADIVQRVPRSVAGVPVEVMVIDDGSSDATATRAEGAGARVVRFEQNRGLGAAVRFGLHDAARRGATAVAFLDADGEYGPEELASLVEPILRGDADYVVGSRFTGDIERMLPHRRLGNVVLTRLLSFIARRRITDGQSGFRALSGAAAADAEIIHDFNYAQVLTLDLLAKGYRYHEVPIGYRFRTTGRSFVKLGRYLRRVVPAVYREVNDVVPGAALVELPQAA
jgi:uncharacterized membrane protein YbhN (UPF0104 family)